MKLRATRRVNRHCQLAHLNGYDAVEAFRFKLVVNDIASNNRKVLQPSFLCNRVDVQLLSARVGEGRDLGVGKLLRKEKGTRTPTTSVDCKLLAIVAYATTKNSRESRTQDPTQTCRR